MQTSSLAGTVESQKTLEYEWRARGDMFTPEELSGTLNSGLPTLFVDSHESKHRRLAPYPG